jgi:hypothetical protein
MGQLRSVICTETCSILFIFYLYLIDTLENKGALLVDLEHRFYGDSQPTGDTSVKSLKYLSAKQALADLANFRDFIHASYNLTDANRWVAFGGSYPGNLAAWVRAKYPSKFYAAVASSAPINVVLDFYQYLEVVNDAFSNYSTQCPKNVKMAMQQMDELYNSISGRISLKKLFKYFNF